jgi:hypothetical protein
MKTYCLIPVIRPHLVGNAIKSAVDNDFSVIAEIDYKEDVNKTRTSLLQQALCRDDCTHIRFLDDDDTLLPHNEFINDKADIFYFNFIINSGIKLEINYTGVPYYDGKIIGVHPWVWVAKKDFLIKMMSVYNNDVWAEHCEGSYFWLKMLKLKPKIKHIPVCVYVWNKGKTGRHKYPQLTTHRGLFKEQMNELVR